MRLNLSFSTPYTRSQIRAGLNNLALPVGAVVSVRPVPVEVQIDETPNAENDEIARLTVDGFTSVAELGAFFTSLPAGINSRLSEVTFS